MKRYNVVFNEEENEGVYAISVVNEPAMESNFITLSKDEKPSLTIELKESEEGKKENILLGVALIPNKPVYRNQNGSEFEIIFSEDTIKKAAHNFLKKGYQHNSTVEHEDNIKGVSIVESWIVKDPNNDAANAYGLNKDDIVEGAWVVKMKCDNKDIYEKAVKGEIKGFSIDGLFDLEEVKLKTDVKMSEIQEEIKKSLKDEIKDFVLDLFKTKKEVKLGSMKAMVGEESFMIEYEGEMLSKDGDVWIMSEDDQRVALPVGEYQLENDMVLVVTEEGIAGDIKEPVMEEEQEVEMSDDVKSVLKDMLAQFKSEYDNKLEIALNAQKEELTKAFNLELNKQKEEFDVQLKETPAAKPIKSAPRQFEQPKNAKQRIYNIISKHN